MTVTVPISVPTAPLTVAAPVVFIVRLDTPPRFVPETEPKEIGVPAPAPTVNVTSFDKVAFPKVICPVDVPPIVDVPVIETVPKFITPVPAALTVPLIVLELGDVAVTPPVNAFVPTKVSVPVLEKVAAFVIVPPPLIATLYPATAVFKVVAVNAPVNVIVPVVAVNVTVAAFTVLLNVVPPD